MMRLFAAPLQGYTESLWRESHAKVYGDSVDSYLSPFVRLEKGEIRRRDLRDVNPADARSYHLIPQIIFKDRKEFDLLTDSLVDLGYQEINLNLGCPFPLQTSRGRGAALLRQGDVLGEIAESISSRPDIRFNVKMRLGMEDPDEWMNIMDILNRMPLEWITLHPRTARQGYKGELALEEFARFVRASVHPVIYNGDILSMEHFRMIAHRFPEIEGIMIGRGLLARPSLAAEIREGAEWDTAKRMEHLRRFYRLVAEGAESRYCGDIQILTKLRPFWEYLEPEIGRRQLKAILKAGNLARYKAAVSSALGD